MKANIASVVNDLKKVTVTVKITIYGSDQKQEMIL
jgi:hypothetical protein